MEINMFKGLRLYLSIFVACFAVLLLINLNKSSPIEIDNGENILAFGDSLTQGVGASPNYDYPSQLAKILNQNVINAGISGETTAEGLKRFERTVNQYNPDAIILLEGGNDFIRNVPRQITHDNLSKMISIAQNKHIPILLVSVPEKGLFLSDAEIYKALAKEYNVPILLDVVSDLLSEPAKKSDLIHLNNDGYFELATKIAEQFHIKN